MNAMPNIRCAVCNKPVDRVVYERHDFSRVQTLKVWCHGQVDTMVLTDEDLQNMTADMLRQLTTQEGVAFARPALN